MPRGISLVMTMLILVLLTLLVTGAIAFSGSDRSAAVSRTRAEGHTACAQAARNLFLSRIRVMSGNVEDITMNDYAPMPDGTQVHLRTGHYTGAPVTLKAIQRLAPNQISSPNDRVGDLTNKVGSGGAIRAAYYAVTATCQEKAGGPEQEVEFVVRVGI